MCMSCVDALRGVSSCVTLDDHPYTSDHLAILCTLDLTHIRHPVTTSFLSQPLDWHQARGSEATLHYAGTCDDIVRPLLEKDYSSIGEVEEDLRTVCKEINQSCQLSHSKEESEALR